MTHEIYENKTRIRVCNLIIIDEKILLLNHSHLNPENTFWAPPGGGLEYQETISDCVIRETKEETTLNVLAHHFFDVSEYISDKLHAVEIFHLVTKFSGQFQLGSDPETLENPILKDIKLFNKVALEKLDSKHLHPILRTDKVLDLIS